MFDRHYHVLSLTIMLAIKIQFVFQSCDCLFKVQVYIINVVAFPLQVDVRPTLEMLRNAGIKVMRLVQMILKSDSSLLMFAAFL